METPFLTALRNRDFSFAHAIACEILKFTESWQGNFLERISHLLCASNIDILLISLTSAIFSPDRSLFPLFDLLSLMLKIRVGLLVNTNKGTLLSILLFRLSDESKHSFQIRFFICLLHFSYQFFVYFYNNVVYQCVYS